MSICQYTMISMGMQEKPYDFNGIHDRLGFGSCKTEGECIPKHKLLVCQTNLKAQKRKHKLPPKRRIWKLSKPEVQASYKNAVKEAFSFILLSDPEFEAHIESIWTKIKSRLIKDQCSHHIKTSQKIGRANQLTGFYMMRTLVVKRLILVITYVVGQKEKVNKKSRNMAVG